MKSPAFAPLLLAGLCLAATPAFADVTKVSGPVPVTATSQIYNSADVPGALPAVNLAAAGYVEEEYLLHGTADAFRRDPSGALAVLAKDIPYGTRIIVRRPKSAAKFSGVVHFEPIHPSQGGTSHWLATYKYILARGDIYVAAGLGDDAPTRATSAKGPVPNAQSQILHWYEPDRYKPIVWPEEDGIRYQVMADIGALLRSDRVDNPLKGLKVRRLLVGGWSFTGSVQRTFINEGFHDRARLPGGKPVFDGYLLGISSRWNGGGYVPLNNAEKSIANDDPRRQLKPIDVPVIEFMTEFEVASGKGAQMPDSDAKVGAHRLYQLGGVIHGSSQVDGNPPRDKRANMLQLAAKGYPIAEVRGEEPGSACPLPISDLPHGPLARAALDNLLRWTDKGTPAPHATPLEWTADGKIARDPVGNALGGLRPAELTVPLARYGAYQGTDLPQCVPPKGRPLFLHNDLPAAEMKARYGSAAAYTAAYAKALDRLVADRFLLAEDAPALKAHAAAQAKAAFAR
ncbi:alpha/beta hydrolase domain-containing protein [Sphingomonas naphthae]|uniref:Alpha/beta hydrolase domain-containing protein n=1 Tax=Sphingomonas naphthae TaxID=1813468 RepID=A0ABY7TGR7_9SPHN|nr:alpha/beta hydrolase domain-containing protein [Sphingomonas naphthae]WCT72421.1 alpha/beta hydrolase domain-containing protein [Sphingomonas naphthae]